MLRGMLQLVNQPEEKLAANLVCVEELVALAVGSQEVK